jgi:branched-chain amino acid transport system substrate-binding protein
VIAALDHAKVTQGPGGSAEMVPGQHHVRMNMYIAQARDGKFKVVKNLGMIEPNKPSFRAIGQAGSERLIDWRS